MLQDGMSVIGDVGSMLVHALDSTSSLLSRLVSTSIGSLDLPYIPSKLESMFGLVKTSGLENSEQVSVVAPAMGLTIGGARMHSRNPSSRSSSSTSHKNRIDEKPSSSSSSSSLKEGQTTTTSRNTTGFNTVVPRSMFVFLVLDLLSIFLVKQSIANACTGKLFINQWVIGGLALGFPGSWLVDSLRRESSFRAAFILELVLLFISFLWLCYGGATVFNTVSACVDSIAPLWWLSYVTSVLSLSVAGTVIFCMIVTTVLSLIYGSKQ